MRLALSQSRLALADIDAIAYTRGPGMYGCLSVCAASAKAIAAVTGKPLIGVHHMVSERSDCVPPLHAQAEGDCVVRGARDEVQLHWRVPVQVRCE